MSEKTVHPPICPECKVKGVENIIQSDSHQESNNGKPLFNIAHCTKCGYVYGVFCKISIGPGRPPMPNMGPPQM